MPRQLIINDINALYTHDLDGWTADEWENEFTQLSPGVLDYRICVINLPELKITWQSINQRILFRETFNSPNLLFGVALEASEMPRFRGRSIDPNVGLVSQFQEENEYVLGPGTRTLSVTVASELAKSRDWDISQQSLHSVPKGPLAALVKVCEAALDVSKSVPGFGVNPTVDYVWRDRVLAALQPVIEPWTSAGQKRRDSLDEPTRAQRVVERAIALLSLPKGGEKISIAEIAAELDMSERAVYDSFQRCFGVGPYEFHMLCKLHAFRTALISGEPFHGKVTQTALASGFQHFGRLTDHYHRHFGETPRQTMKRWAESES